MDCLAAHVSRTTVAVCSHAGETCGKSAWGSQATKSSPTLMRQRKRCCGSCGACTALRVSHAGYRVLWLLAAYITHLYPRCDINIKGRKPSTACQRHGQCFQWKACVYMLISTLGLVLWAVQRLLCLSPLQSFQLRPWSPRSTCHK